MRLYSEREMKDRILPDYRFSSIKEMLIYNAVHAEGRKVLAELNDKNEIVYYTAQDILDNVCTLGDGLLALGLEDSHIAIVSQNCCRYVFVDMTVSCGVGVVTPIDKDAPLELMTQLLSKCDATAVFTDMEHVGILEDVQKRYSGLKTIITMDGKYKDYLSFDEVVELGKKPENAGKFLAKELDVNKPAKILFTSGTTGANKGVVLTNANLAANMENCLDVMRIPEENLKNNCSLSVLPMHHSTEINTHVMSRVFCARLTVICKNPKDLLRDLKIFKPTMVMVVPMIVNAFYKGIWANAKRLGKDEKLKKGIKLSNCLRRLGINITHKLFSEVLENFGGNLTQIICGGAMLNPSVVSGFNDLGICIANGYGITECGPLVCINSETMIECKSVGKPCPNLEVRIENPDSDGVGDLCVSGLSVAKGYYKDEEATKKVFYEDGFFNTGDSAYLDKEGRIVLTGRKKNVIILSNGKNVCPEEVENVIESNLSYVNECAVYQAKYEKGTVSQSVLCAEVYIDDSEKRNDTTAIKDDIKKVNSLLPDYKHIEYIVVRDKEFAKTSTKKIKRDLLPTVCPENGMSVIGK